MYGMDFQREMVKERTRGYVAEAEERRLAKVVGGHAPSFRARAARWLFGIAVKLERNATWSAVWEEMGATKHS